MTTMTEVNSKAKVRKQLIELGRSRCKHDFHDLFKIQEWFDQHGLSYMFIVIRVDHSFRWWHKSWKSRSWTWNSKTTWLLINVTEASIKKSNHIKPLVDLKPGIYVEKLNIKPSILFSRLIAIVQRKESICVSPNFEHELTTFPTSLFNA